MIGGGISVLEAAITEAKKWKLSTKADALKEGVKILVLKKSPHLGSWIVSDTGNNGYTIDCSFALLIKEYPFFKQLLD